MSFMVSNFSIQNSWKNEQKTAYHMDFYSFLVRFVFFHIRCVVLRFADGRFRTILVDFEERFLRRYCMVTLGCKVLKWWFNWYTAVTLLRYINHYCDAVCKYFFLKRNLPRIPSVQPPFCSTRHFD